MDMGCFDFYILWLIQVIERAGELLESSGKKKKKREEIERAGELLESSSGSKRKIKEERMKE